MCSGAINLSNFARGCDQFEHFARWPPKEQSYQLEIHPLVIWSKLWKTHDGRWTHSDHTSSPWTKNGEIKQWTRNVFVKHYATNYMLVETSAKNEKGHNSDQNLIRSSTPWFQTACTPQSCQGCHSCMQHVMSSCSTFVPSIIKIFLRVFVLQIRDKKSNSNTRRGGNSKSKKKSQIFACDISSGPVLHYYQVSSKYSKECSTYRADTKSMHNQCQI